MKSNRLIIVIAAAFSLFVYLPRILFLLQGKGDEAVNQMFLASPSDTAIRIMLLFSFSFIVLKYNLSWNNASNSSMKIWLFLIVNLLILIIWQLFFALIDAFIYGVFDGIVNAKLNTIMYMFFLFVLNLISTAISLIEKSKKDSIEKGILIQKNLQNELDALRNQINPHFLFNSLNTLSLLVREDQKAAGRFISKLSFLYRYILQSQEKELVTVKEELKVLDSYVYLIVQRYEENFQVKINISDELLSRQIPILALQILMENVVKHNEISNNKPMVVEVYEEEDWIVVKNRLQKRSGPIESTHTGLKNLNTRVRIRMNKEIKISRNNDYFTVKTPTL